MKMKRKGNVYPFLSSTAPPPSSSSSSCSSSYKDTHSALKLLPVAISTLALSLPNEDQEVLAYLITVSIIATTASPLKDKCRTANSSNGKNKKAPKVPPFQCGCFDCYTSFWYRWDSSPNRELIHQVIEAFEDQLLQNESARNHRRSKIKKRGNKVIYPSTYFDILANKPESGPGISVAEDESEVLAMPENTAGGGGGDKVENGVACEEEKIGHHVTDNLEMAVVTVQDVEGTSSKSLARKVLPDVVGLLNFRLWNLWSPGIYNGF